MQQSMFNGRISNFYYVLDSIGEILKDNGNDFLSVLNRRIQS